MSVKSLAVWLLLAAGAHAQEKLSVQDAVRRAWQHHPALQRQQHQVRAGGAAADRVESDLYPHATALSLPVYTAGGIEAEVRQAEEQEKAAQERVREVEQNLQLQVEQARIRYSNQKSRRSAYLDQMRAAEDASRLARTRYKLGLGDILALQQADVALLRAQTQVLRNRAEIWLAWSELLYVTGRLREMVEP